MYRDRTLCLHGSTRTLAILDLYCNVVGMNNSNETIIYYYKGYAFLPFQWTKRVWVCGFVYVADVQDALKVGLRLQHLQVSKKIGSLGLWNTGYTCRIAKHGSWEP
jgi:hypothetical protein